MHDIIVIYGNNLIQAGLLGWAMTLLVGKRPTLNQIFTFALAYGLAVPLSRLIYDLLPVPFFTHTILLFFWAIVLYWVVFKLPIVKAIIAGLIGIIIFFIVDGLLIIQLVRIFNITIEAGEANYLFLTFVFLTINICFIGIIILNKITGFSIFKEK